MENSQLGFVMLKWNFQTAVRGNESEEQKRKKKMEREDSPWTAGSASTSGEYF